MGGGETCIFFFARTRGRVCGAVRKGAGARRPRRALAGAQAAGCVWAPSPAPPELVTLVAFMTPGAGWGSAAAPGSARVRARVGAAEPQPGRRARPPRRGAPAGGRGGGGGPRIGAAGGTSPARRPCGPLRPCGLCAERAPESERASEREKYKYGRPRQWEKRPGHFLPAWAAENGLVECAGASPRRVLCVHGGKASPTPTAHTHTHTHAHTRGPAAGLGGREFAFSSSPPPPSRPTV